MEGEVTRSTGPYRTMLKEAILGTATGSLLAKNPTLQPYLPTSLLYLSIVLDKDFSRHGQILASRYTENAALFLILVLPRD